MTGVPEGATAGSPRALWREVAIVYALTVVLSAALVWSEGASAFLRRNVHAFVGIVFVAVPFWVLQRRDESFRRFGVAFGGVLDRAETPGGGLVGFFVDLVRAIARAVRPFVRETAFALAIALVVFPPYAIGFPLLGPRFLGPLAHPFRWPAADLGAGVWNLAAGNLLVVAVPEEFLYRGYLQTRLDDLLPPRWRLLGASVGWGLVVQAALFALGHFVIDADPNRLGVFFPALLFGWMRARRGSVGAAVWLHALSNVFSDILFQGYYGPLPRA